LDTNTVIKGFSLSNGYITSGSGYGAGAYVYNTTVLFDDVKIIGNRVFVPGGHGYGAGLHLYNSASVIRNSFISDNSIDSATWCYGGGVYISGGSPQFTNVTISNNSARAENWCYGVGLYASNNSTLNLNEVKVTGNISGNNAIWYYGNGIYLDDAVANLFNVLVASNVSGTGGSFNYGGGIYCDGALGNVFMMNCTVTENIKSGNGTITGSGVYARDAVIIAVNSIFYNTNAGSETGTVGSGVVDILWSDIRGGYAGMGNISQVPGFASSTDFHLLTSSPCAGAGTDNGAPFIDLDATPRPLPLLTMPDMGCYEVDQSATALAEGADETIAIHVYPNPVIAGNALHIKSVSSQFQIIDITGRIVFSSVKEKDELVVETNGWNSGWYFVYSQGKRGEKFVVMD